MQPHQQRVVDEKTELDKKAKALSEFIGNNPIFETLEPAEQERLKEQNVGAERAPTAGTK